MTDGTAFDTAELHLVLGPVGAGKSTFARRLARERRALHLNLDDWMATLFSPDRPASDVIPWYRARTDRCVAQIWKLSCQMFALRHSVVLELGLIQRADRAAFFERVAASGRTLTIHVLDASREVRRARVEQRNTTQGETFAMHVPPAIFELASDLWQPLEQDECPGCTVHFIRTD